MTFAIKLTGACTDTTLATLERDVLLSGDNGGIKFLFDLAFPFSYTGGTPVNGSQIDDVSETTTAAGFTLVYGQTMSYSGGGFDFSSCTKTGTVMQIPASVAASIWANTNQYFLTCLYLKLPTSGNWNSNATIAPFLQWAADSYLVGADVLSIFEATGGALSFRRQKAAASADTITLTPAVGDYGNVVQIAFWRDSTGQYARLKSANGTISTSGAVSTNNTQNFSALPMQIGIPVSSFIGGSGSVIGTSRAGQENAYKMRIYRGFVENLEVSGRGATAVLDDDYTRTVARGVFS